MNKGWLTNWLHPSGRNQRRGQTEIAIERLEARMLPAAVGPFVPNGQSLETTSGLVALGDLNNDGSLDVATPGRILINDGSGRFRLTGQDNGPYVNDIALGDLNGDGLVDVRTVGEDGNYRQNNGVGEFSKIFGSSSSVMAVALGDIDGDGKLDILSALNDIGLSARRNIGDGTYGYISLLVTDQPDIELFGNIVFSAPDGRFDCALADVDGDGDLDVLSVAHDRLEVLRNDGGTRFSVLSTVQITGRVLTLGDLNGDGALDALIVGGEEKSEATTNDLGVHSTFRVGGGQLFEVLINDSNGNFAAQSANDIGFTPSAAALDDLDGDGDLDAVVVNKDGMDFVFWNNGNGTFSTVGERISNRKASSVAVGDVNNDGRPDIVIGAAFNPDGTPADQDEVLLNAMATSIALPGLGGTFEVIRDGNDVVVRRFQGEEVFRGDIGDIRGLDLRGTTGDETVVVDFSNGNPLPIGGLGFAPGGIRDRNSLRFTGMAVDQVKHTANGPWRGTVEIDGRYVRYTGVASIRDELVTPERVIELSDNDDIASLTDDPIPANGISHLAITGGTSIDFAQAAGTLTIFGKSGNDQLRVLGMDSTTAIVVSLFGDGGNDVLVGGIEQDILDGGTGADTLLGGANDDVFHGGAGADLIKGGNGNDVLMGDDGDDSLLAGAGQDSLNGGNGNDTLRGEGGSFDSLTGGAGDDLLDGGTGADMLIESGDVDFTLTAYKLVGMGTDRFVSISLVQLSGGSHANKLDASAWFGPVTLSGGDGDDTLKGSRVSDELRGGDGADVLIGNQGDDTLSGESGRDLLIGSAGNDLLTGGADDDVLLGDSGQDSLFGEDGKDILLGGDGNDRLDGGRDDDTIAGNGGNDQLLAIPSEINERFSYKRPRI